MGTCAATSPMAACRRTPSTTAELPCGRPSTTHGASPPTPGRWEYCGVRKCSCPSGFFGKNCEKQCNCKYGNGDCNGITGTCRRGCAYGFSGAGCQTRIAAVPKNCYMTSWINGWDARMNYYVPSGWVLSGSFSMHDNGREDRIWKAIICSMNE